MKHAVPVIRPADNTRAVFTYDVVRCAFFRPDGEQVPGVADFGAAEKSAPGRSVRLSLGHRCNFACAYCSQKKCDDIANPLEPAELASAVHNRLGGERVASLQFWGGEPYVYRRYIRDFHAAFHTLRPGTAYGASSNGSLFSDDALTDWLIENGISSAFSHDGPGQSLRGREILDEVTVRRNLARMHAARLLTLQPVMHRRNADLAACVAHIEERVKAVGIPVLAAEPLRIYRREHAEIALDDAELREYAIKRHRAHLAGYPVPRNMSLRLLEFARGYGKSPGLTPGCHVIRSRTLVIDRAGNILDCQNFAATDVDESGDAHKLGSVLADWPPVSPKLTRLSARLGRCGRCLVHRQCGGGCAFDAAAFADKNCAASFWQALILLGLCLAFITGNEWSLDMENISGQPPSGVV